MDKLVQSQSRLQGRLILIGTETENFSSLAKLMSKKKIQTKAYLIQKSSNGGNGYWLHFGCPNCAQSIVGECCVFRLANGCSACRLMVEIICFCVKTNFLSFSITNGKKKEKRKESTKNNKKNMHKRWVYQH